MERRVDRRGHPRVAYESQVEVYHDGRLAEPPPAASDLSEGGVQLHGANVPLFARLKVFVPVANDEGHGVLVMLEGEVVWRRARRLGVRFLAAPATLRAFVRRQGVLLH